MNSIEWNSRRAPLRRYFENSYRRHQFFKVRRTCPPLQMRVLRSKVINSLSMETTHCYQVKILNYDTSIVFKHRFKKYMYLHYFFNF